MSIQLTHTSEEFKHNEIKTLEFIASRSFFDNDFPELAAAIRLAYDQYRGYNKKKAFDFIIASDFTMAIEGHNHRVVIHGEVIGNYENTNYSFGICGNDGTMELIRRFHFDYVHKNKGKKQKVPVSHLQYGGLKGGVNLKGEAFLTNNIYNKLSVPRLLHAPLNFAMLLDLIFTELTSEQTLKIVDDLDWRSLVRKNEEFILANYYKVIANHIGTVHHTKDSLVRDICYA